jgi:hypothetical protein
MAPYHSNGFIGNEINAWINETKNKHSAIFKTAENLNQECYIAIDNVTIDSNDLRKTLVACLFARCMELYQGVYILVSHGMSPSSNIILRALMEAVFVLCAVIKNDEALEAYVLDGENERLKITRKLLADKNSPLSAEEIDILKKVECNLALQTKQLAAKRLSTEEFAKKANLHSWYLTAYAKTSWAVHTTIRDMDQYLVFDNKEKLKSIRFIPSDEESEKGLATACDLMIISFREFLNLFEKDISICDNFAQQIETIMRA